MKQAELEERALELHRQAIVVDATCPLVKEDRHWPRWIEGGATAAFSTVSSEGDCRLAIGEIAQWCAMLNRYRDKMVQATTVEGIRRAKKEGKLAIVFQFQNTTAVENDLDLLEVFHRLGVRTVQLAYNQKNAVGDGCNERTDCGLSDFGMMLIRELNRLGMLVDLSHTGYRTTMEAMEVSEKPVAFTHSNVRAICDSPRNLADDQIDMLARKDGVIGMNGFPYFVSKRPRPTLDDLLDHVDYIANRVGTQHIGIGLDFYIGSPERYEQNIRWGRWKPEAYPPPPYLYPDGIEDASKLGNITRGLLARGYSDSDVLAILGGNFLRLFENIWGA